MSVVGALAAWLGPGMGGDDGYDGAQARRFRIFANLFTFMMLFAVVSNNVGFMWIAIEATTITSAMLIPLHVTKASVEASWKYILIGSVGIALAFGGTVLGYFDFVNLAGHREAALNWTVLMASAPRLHPQVIQLAFVFILIGYGTKAGLAPMHTWLPDAHSEAPAPLSAMMSGVLLAVALYAVIRWKAVVNAAVGTEFTDDLFIAMGLLSLAIGAFSLVIQRNYKRMLAYSSIEHTGLICVGLALGPLGMFAAMLHLLNHALAKSTMFFLAGRVLHRYRHDRDQRRVGPPHGHAVDGRAVRGGHAGRHRAAALRPLHLRVRALPRGLRRGSSVADGARPGAARGGLRLDDRPPEPDALRRARRGRDGGRGERVAAGAARPLRGGPRRSRAHAAGAAPRRC